MKYDKLCEDVLNANPDIRFTGILNSKGELVTQKSRDKVALLSDEEVRMSVHYTFERWNRLQNLEHKLGKEKATITEYENVTMVSLLLEGNLFLLSMEPDSNYSKIISKIKTAITSI